MLGICKLNFKLRTVLTNSESLLGEDFSWGLRRENTVGPTAEGVPSAMSVTFTVLPSDNWKFSLLFAQKN